MSDIVDRLNAELTVFDMPQLVADAADEIVRLRNQLDAARTGKALLALEAERALCDQLAEALRVCATDAERSTPAHADDRDWRLRVAQPMTRAALAAYEAARKEGA